MNAQAMAAHEVGSFAKGTHPHADTWSFPPAPAEHPEHPHMDDALCQQHCEKTRSSSSHHNLISRGCL